MYGYLRVSGRHGRHAAAPAQCGLCAHFGARYRTRTRWLAGWDPTVLALLIDALGDEPAPRLRVRCPIPLARARAAIDPAWAPMGAVAAVQLFLAGEKLFDDRVDRDGWASRLAERLLRRDIAGAEAELIERGFPLEPVRAILRRQREVEADPTSDLDALARPTAEALATTLRWTGCHAGVPAPGPDALGAFGAALGRALYLVDAVHDLVEDGARGEFNPLLTVLGGARTPAAAAFLRGALQGRIRTLEAAFEALEVRRNEAVLHAATVESLRTRGLEALAALPVQGPASAMLAGVRT